MHEPAPDTVTMRRFQVEAQAAASLTHPNIVTVYDFGAAGDNQLYLIMDFVEGTSLAEAIGDAEHLEVDRGLNIFIQACEALEHAHRRGIIHRDLKPSNIMLADDEFAGDFVKIVDFGLAKLMFADGQSEKLTQTGDLLGTPLYMSPEQCRGEPSDHRSDIYSLGCIMYRVLSGRQPIYGRNAFSTLYQHISKDPDPFASSAPEIEIPVELERVVFRSLHKDPAARYQSMADLAADLKKVREMLARGSSGCRKRVPFDAWFRSRPAKTWAVAALAAVLAFAAAISLLFSYRSSHVETRAAAASQSAKPSASKTTKSPRSAPTTGKPSSGKVTVTAGKRQPGRQVTPGEAPSPAYRRAYDYGRPAAAPPVVAPDRTYNAMPRERAAGGAISRSAYDGSGNFPGSAGETFAGPAQVADSHQPEPGAPAAYEGPEQLHGYASSASAPSSTYARGRGKKGGKHARLARTIGNVAEDLLSESASGVGTTGRGLGRKVGKYGRFLKDLVDDH